jgi:hypothetical protein
MLTINIMASLALRRILKDHKPCTPAKTELRPMAKDKRNVDMASLARLGALKPCTRANTEPRPWAQKAHEQCQGACVSAHRERVASNNMPELKEHKNMLNKACAWDSHQQENRTYR